MLLIGRGSIGKRYAAILNYLHVPFVSVDPYKAYRPYPEESVFDGLSEKVFKRSNTKKCIIATPSETHGSVLRNVLDIGFDTILIEKPMFTDVRDYQMIWNADLRLVMNYQFLDPKTEGKTEYFYYDSGQESLSENLFQLIALARTSFTYDGHNPVWSCTLNGRELTLEDIHKSYVIMLEQWLKNPEILPDVEKAYDLWNKVKSALELEFNQESAPNDSRTKFSVNFGAV